MSHLRTCSQCEREFIAKRPHALTCSGPCRLQRWIENQLPAPVQRVQTGKRLTQRDRILFELRNAGERGVHSETFYRLSMPRFAARILELKEAGHNITSTPEGNGARYRLVGSSAVESKAPSGAGASGTHSSLGSTPDPRGAASSETEPLSLFGEGPKRPSMYDPDMGEAA